MNLVLDNVSEVVEMNDEYPFYSIANNSMCLNNCLTESIDQDYLAMVTIWWLVEFLVIVEVD